MLFENLYQEADKAIRRRWLISFGAALLLFLCYTANAWITAAARDIYSPSEESLREARQYLKASALCSELPTPEQFRRMNPATPRSASLAAQVFHHYHSEREFDEIIPTFLVWFESNGWKRVSEDALKSPVATYHPNRKLIFRKTNSIVTIVHYYPDSDGYVPPANYEFGCRYEDGSFAAYD